RIYQAYNDQDLVLKIKQNDIKAFEEIYFRYKGKLKSFTNSYIKDSIQSEEVLQEVFIKLWEKRHLIDENLSLKCYLFQIVKNHIFNLFRKKVHEIRLEDGLSVEHYAKNYTEEQMDYYDLKKTTLDLINKLPLAQRSVITMSKLEELNNDEISIKLNLSKRTVEHHIYLAIKSLKKSLLLIK
ncbi:MAG: RNA polymerase sigma-70 factor, partial [Bacteroidota bacterium]|nr:RNA polymerase sigma-70 factor [Bacteroidota bacterium]